MPAHKSSWMTHLDKVFKEGKKKNKNYTYTQAMKDAKTTYKKHHSKKHHSK